MPLIYALIPNKIINIKSHKLLVYANDIDIIGRTLQEVTAIFFSIRQSGFRCEEARGKINSFDERRLLPVGTLPQSEHHLQF